MSTHHLQNKVESLCCPTDELVTFVMSHRCLSVVCSPFILVHPRLLLSPQFPASHRCTNKLRCTVSANFSELLPLSSFFLPFLLLSPPRFLLRSFLLVHSSLLLRRCRARLMCSHWQRTHFVWFSQLFKVVPQQKISIFH